MKKYTEFENDGKYVHKSQHTFNQENLEDYSIKTDPDFRRAKDTDIIYDKIHNTDWNKESNYHNSVRINGKNTTRTLRMSNRDWHKLNNITK